MNVRSGAPGTPVSIKGSFGFLVVLFSCYYIPLAALWYCMRYSDITIIPESNTAANVAKIKYIRRYDIPCISVHMS